MSVQSPLLKSTVTYDAKTGMPIKMALINSNAKSNSCLTKSPLIASKLSNKKTVALSNIPIPNAIKL